MRLPITVTAVAVSVLWQDAIAVACSCGLGAPRVLPPNGTIGLPTNASVYVVADPNEDRKLDVSVIDSSNDTPVSIVVDDHGRWLRVSAAFEANHTYDVVVVVDGSTTHSSFTTGTDTDVVPPSFPGIGALTLETMTWPVVQPDGSGCSGSCVPVRDGHISRVRIDFDAPSSDVALLVFARYRASDHSLIDEVVLDPPWTTQALLGNSVCGDVPVLEPGIAYCGRVIAYDTAGNVSGTGAEACSVAQVCDPELDPAATCSPSPECRTSSGSGCRITKTGGGGVIVWFGLGALLFGRRRRVGNRR